MAERQVPTNPYQSVWVGSLKPTLIEISRLTGATLSDVVMTFVKAHLHGGVEEAAEQYEAHRRMDVALGLKEEK